MKIVRRDRVDNINVLDYKIEIIKDDAGDYIATMPSLGCIADGETIDEAIEELKEIAETFIELAKKDGKAIPIPEKYKEDINYSGKLTLRIPKSLHRMVTEQAEKEGCSINQLLTTYISLGVGNEFGKKHVSINLDAPSNVFDEAIKQQWEKHAGNKETKMLNLNIAEVYPEWNSEGDRRF